MILVVISKGVRSEADYYAPLLVLVGLNQFSLDKVYVLKKDGS